MSDWTREDQAALERMAKEGKTSYQMADALGRSRSAIMGRCKRTGVGVGWKPRGPDHTPRKSRRHYERRA
jgi:hypothetical protein